MISEELCIFVLSLEVLGRRGQDRRILGLYVTWQSRAAYLRGDPKLLCEGEMSVLIDPLNSEISLLQLLAPVCARLWVFLL